MDEISKRTFLAAGLAATLPLSAPSLEARAAEPGRKLGYAILGLGYYATKIIMPRFAECEHSKLVALVSGSPDKLKRFGAQYGVPEGSLYSYETFDRIADNPDVDIVYVITPNSLHRVFTERAAKAGKHVMCEKPMATTSALTPSPSSSLSLLVTARSTLVFKPPHKPLSVLTTMKPTFLPPVLVTMKGWTYSGLA